MENEKNSETSPWEITNKKSTVINISFFISFINLLNTNNCTKSCSQTNCLQAIITPCIRSEIDPASDSRFSVQAIGDFDGVLFCGTGRY